MRNCHHAICTTPVTQRLPRPTETSQEMDKTGRFIIEVRRYTSLHTVTGTGQDRPLPHRRGRQLRHSVRRPPPWGPVGPDCCQLSHVRASVVCVWGWLVRRGSCSGLRHAMACAGPCALRPSPRAAARRSGSNGIDGSSGHRWTMCPRAASRRANASPF